MFTPEGYPGTRHIRERGSCFLPVVSTARINDGRQMAKLTEALGGCALQQVVNGSTHHCALATRVNSESTNINTMATSNVLHHRGLADNLHKLLTSITFLVDVADITGGHFLLERDADGLLEGVSSAID